MTPISVSLAAEQLRRRVPGGIGTYARGLLKGIAELATGERPRITIVASRPPFRPDPLTSFGCPVVCSRLPGPLMTRAWDLGLTRVGRGSDVVHSVSLAVPVASSGVPLVMTVHDVAWRSMPEAFPPRGRRWHEAALRRAASRAAIVVVPSEATANAVLAAGVGIADDRLVVVNEGADHLGEPDEPAAQALLERLGVLGPYLLTVSTLEPRKNLPALVEAWREVRRHHAVELVLVGRRRADFPALAEEPGLRMMGEVPDAALPQLYSGALALVYPSLYEGFGLPVLEAMQCGACVIASRAVAEAAGDAAVYAESPTDLARAMSEAAARPEWRAELGARSLERAREFSWERTARMTHEVYEEARRRFGD